MRSAIATVIVAGALVIGGISSLNDDSTEPPSTQLELGGPNVIRVVRNRVPITPGDSRNTLDLERERIRRDREVLARETRGGSYTGTGSKAEVIGYSKENCVQYAKRRTGIQRTLGAGGRLAIQGPEPQVGAIGVEKKRVHAVIITKIEGDQITIEEANWIKSRITRRVLSRSDFMGYVYN